MAVWTVRAGKFGEQESYALENGVIVNGWDDMPSLDAASTPEEMRAICEATYPEAPKKRIINFASQLWAFVGRIQEGDIVALPLKTRAAVALGKVSGPYRYAPDNPTGTKHLRPVEWIRRDMPRAEFGQDMLYSMGAFLTVFRVTRNEAETRFAEIIRGNKDPLLRRDGGLSPPVVEDDVEAEATPEVVFDLEQHAKDQISALIAARFGGDNLTRLVAAILKAQGCQTYVSPRGPDGGVDILAGRGPMGFDPPRLCVQVKAWGSPVDVGVLRELQGVMKNFGAEQGLLVSWGGFKDSVYREARTLFFEIRLWDSNSLMQALLDNYERLPDDIQAELPLKRIWALVLEE